MMRSCDRGSLSLLGVVIIALAGIMIGIIWIMEQNELRLVETDILREDMRMVAENSCDREYRLLSGNSEKVQEILCYQEGLHKTGNYIVPSDMECDTYVGVVGNTLIIWAVVRKNEIKVQCGYCLDVDRETGECCLRGMF
ncbi:MAG: hypothetical protein K6C05_10625 [Anaerovibrio sp.]|nr:hypothetical protein [Anaerovibrio sp.]